MVQGLWQYPARIEPVYVPASESETFAAAWGQAVVPPGMLRKGRWVPGLSGWGCPGQAWEVPWIDATVGSGWASTPPSRPQSATTEPVLNPAPAAVEWGWQAELPVPALSRSRTQRAEPAMVLYEPVAAVLPPFTWYVGMHHVPVRRPRDSTAPAAMELINFGSLGVSPGTELYWQPVSILFGSIV